ncbi:MAG: hypothetical protein E7311_01160 [Clostridiales bacterium]|nr:hypothetical protein [Clostridiales bacterium]
MKKFIIGIVIGILIFGLLVGAYILVTKNTNKENVLENSNDQIIHKVENNGGYIVKYEDSEYYWMLNEKSREGIALWAEYMEDSNIKNELVCKKGSDEKVLLTDYGYGKIYMSNNRIYLSSNNSDYNKQDALVYSVNFDGTDKKVYEDVSYIYAGDDNYIIARKGEKVISLATKDGKITELCDNNKGYYFEAMFDNEVFYAKYNDEKTKYIELRSVETNGKNDKLIQNIVLTDFETYEDINEINVIDMKKHEEYIYLSYGWFDGTANVLQENKLARINLENSTFEKILDNGRIIEFVTYNGKDYLIVEVEVNELDSAISYELIKINIETLQQENINYVSQKFNDELIPIQEILKSKQIELKDMRYSFKNIEEIGEYAYYLIDISSLYPQGDIGWRTAYKREKSLYVKQNTNTNDFEVLYMY